MVCWSYLKRGHAKEVLGVNRSTVAFGAKRFNPLKTKIVLDNVQNFSSYVTKEMRLQNKDQPVNAVCVNNPCILSELYETRKYSRRECRGFNIKPNGIYIYLYMCIYYIYIYKTGTRI